MSSNLLGSGDLTWLFWDVYEARLFAETGINLYSTPLTLELTYKRDFEGRAIGEQTISELKNIGVDEGIINQWNDKILDLFPNIKEGDTISANFDPEKGLTLYHNRSIRFGEISDLAFSRHFLDIWLGEKTRAPKLRLKLLGQS